MATIFEPTQLGATSPSFNWQISSYLGPSCFSVGLQLSAFFLSFTVFILLPGIGVCVIDIKKMPIVRSCSQYTYSRSSIPCRGWLQVEGIEIDPFTSAGSTIPLLKTHNYGKQHRERASQDNRSTVKFRSTTKEELWASFTQPTDMKN